MANYATLISAVQSVITQNGNNEITGPILQQTLLAIINALGSGYQFIGIATPETVPGTPDQKVFYIGSSGTYPNFGPAVIPDGNLAIFYYDSSWSYGSVAFPLGDGAVTEAKLAVALANKLFASGYKYVGIAVPSTNPGTPNQNVFYISTPGTYPNFGSATIPNGYIGIFKYNGVWTTETIQVGDANAVKFVVQTLTNTQKNQARTNIDAASNEQVNQLAIKLNQFGGYLIPLLRKIVYKDDNAENLINSINVLLNTDELLSITVVYTQSGAIYVGEPLDDLKAGLVVTANYASGTSVEVNDYALSGTLAAGTSAITVTYQDKTTTFNVTVTDALYYILGKMMPGKVGTRNSVTTAAGLNLGVTIDGVEYLFTNDYSKSASSTTQKRCAYPAFDLLLTAGKRYKYIIEFTSALTGSKTIQASNAYYDSTYQAAGVANVKQICDYSNNVSASAWTNTTKDGNTVSFEEVAPTGYVGVRTSLKLLSSGTETVWSLTVKRLIIQEVE